jgi:cytochrome c oxidase cbb3-type subunit 3
MEKKDDSMKSDTGHEWDGIRELTNYPPRWWMTGFYFSIGFIAAYFILYPAIPLVSDYTRGLLGWTQIKELNEGLSEVQAVRAPFEKRLSQMEAGEILNDPEIKRYAETSAKVLFGDNCAACHGSGGQGNPGFPVLADDDWLWGGTIENVIETITDGREGVMIAFKDSLSEKEIDDVVQYVIGLRQGKVYEPGRAVFLGETPGGAICKDCHGEDAKGTRGYGSANLTDSIYRFDGSKEGIRHTILHGVNQEDDPLTRGAIMPTFGKKLAKDDIKKLAVKVWSLGGGKKEDKE